MRKIFRIRRLQRLFGHIGQWLQKCVGDDLRKDLLRHLKKE